MGNMAIIENMIIRFKMTGAVQGSKHVYSSSRLRRRSSNLDASDVSGAAGLGVGAAGLGGGAGGLFAGAVAGGAADTDGTGVTVG